MIAQEHNRLVIKGIRQAAIVSVHWSLVVQNYAQPGSEKSMTILIDDRSPTSARDMVAREMRSRSLAGHSNSRIWKTLEARPKPLEAHKRCLSHKCPKRDSVWRSFNNDNAGSMGDGPSDLEQKCSGA
jgi:hypothetical protein